MTAAESLCRVAGVKVVKFSKSVNNEKANCWRTVVI